MSIYNSLNHNTHLLYQIENEISKKYYEINKMKGFIRTIFYEMLKNKREINVLISNMNLNKIDDTKYEMIIHDMKTNLIAQKINLRSKELKQKVLKLEYKNLQRYHNKIKNILRKIHRGIGVYNG